MIVCTKVKPGPLGAPGLESLQRVKRCKTSGREYNRLPTFHATPRSRDTSPALTQTYALGGWSMCAQLPGGAILAAAWSRKG